MNLYFTELWCFWTSKNPMQKRICRVPTPMPSSKVKKISTAQFLKGIKFVVIEKEDFQYVGSSILIAIWYYPTVRTPRKEKIVCYVNPMTNRQTFRLRSSSKKNQVPRY